MSNTINPYSASRSDLQRSVQPDLEEEGLRSDAKKDAKKSDQRPGKQVPGNPDAEPAGPGEQLDQAALRDQANSLEASAAPARFDATLEGAIDKSDAPQHAAGIARHTGKLEGLSNEEQQMIYRYFPESPSLDLRLYKQDRSPDKVDPGSVGSRVDVRG